MNPIDVKPFFLDILTFGLIVIVLVVIFIAVSLRVINYKQERIKKEYDKIIEESMDPRIAIEKRNRLVRRAEDKGADRMITIVFSMIIASSVLYGLSHYNLNKWHKEVVYSWIEDTQPEHTSAVVNVYKAYEGAEVDFFHNDKLFSEKAEIVVDESATEPYITYYVTDKDYSSLLLKDEPVSVKINVPVGLTIEEKE